MRMVYVIDALQAEGYERRVPLPAALVWIWTANRRRRIFRTLSVRYLDYVNTLDETEWQGTYPHM